MGITLSKQKKKRLFSSPQPRNIAIRQSIANNIQISISCRWVSSFGVRLRYYPRNVTVAETVTVSVTVLVIVGVALFFTGMIVNAGVGTTGVEANRAVVEAIEV